VLLVGGLLADAASPDLDHSRLVTIGGSHAVWQVGGLMVYASTPMFLGTAVVTVLLEI